MKRMQAFTDPQLKLDHCASGLTRAGTMLQDLAIAPTGNPGHGTQAAKGKP